MSAIFPAAVATLLQMLQAINNTKVTLNVNAGIGDTTLTVDDSSPLPTSGYVTFDDNETNPETVNYTGKSGNNLTGVTRGADSTAAGTHIAGAHLEMRWNAAYHNTLATEIIAVEQNLSDRIGVDAGSHYLTIVDGAVATPSLTFAADLDTGIYRIGANDIAIATGGTKALEVNGSQQVVIPKTSSQIILGATNTVTISATAPTGSRVYTIPDAGGAASFILSVGTATLSLSTSLTVTAVTNQIVLGTTNTVTISSIAPASSRTYTIPDAGGAASFVMTAGTQTIAGATTFSATLTMSGATIAMGSNKITGLAAATAAGDALRYEQLFVAGTVTLLGSLAFNPTTAGIVGTTTNDAATAGNVGEVVSSVVGNTAFGANGVAADITTISLTAGDWDITIEGDVNGTSTITGNVLMGISVTAGNSLSGLVTGSNQWIIGVVALSTIPNFCVSAYRLPLSSTTTVRMKAYADYTGTAPNAAGRLSARRFR